LKGTALKLRSAYLEKIKSLLGSDKPKVALSECIRAIGLKGHSKEMV
jgi:hypothetical protein